MANTNPVIFAMGSVENIKKEAISNGQILISPEEGKVFIDKNSSRYELAKSPKQQIIISNIQAPGVDLVVTSDIDLCGKLLQYVSNTFKKTNIIGYHIFLLNGTYTLKSVLEIQGAIIEGESCENTIINTTTGYFKSKSYDYPFVIKNLTMNTTNNTAYGIYLEYGQNNFIDNINFIGFSTAISLNNQRNNKITNCFFKKCGIGAFSGICSGEGTKINLCSFQECGIGISANAGEIAGKDIYTENTFTGCTIAISAYGPFIISNNSIDLTQAQTTTAPIGIKCANYCNVSNNRIKAAGTPGKGIIIDGKNCVVSGNTLFPSDNNNHYFECAIEATSNAIFSLIVNNSITNHQNIGITNLANLITIIGNNLSNCNTGIICENSRKNNISNNTFQLGGYGLKIKYSDSDSNPTNNVIVANICQSMSVPYEVNEELDTVHFNIS